ncbi:MAG: hypothetical protein FWC43_07240 [Planctomycetaceae bacterium]|nr:hypothetical protein [Planctomycetaceae bacterium]
MPTFDALASKILGPIGKAASYVLGIFAKLAPSFSMFGSLISKGIGLALKGILGPVGLVLTGAELLKYGLKALNYVLENFKWSYIIDGFKEIFKTLWNGITSVAKGVVNLGASIGQEAYKAGGNIAANLTFKNETARGRELDKKLAEAVAKSEAWVRQQKATNERLQKAQDGYAKALTEASQAVQPLHNNIVALRKENQETWKFEHLSDEGKLKSIGEKRSGLATFNASYEGMMEQFDRDIEIIKERAQKERSKFGISDEELKKSIDVGLKINISKLYDNLQEEITAINKKREEALAVFAKQHGIDKDKLFDTYKSNEDTDFVWRRQEEELRNAITQHKQSVADFQFQKDMNTLTSHPERIAAITEQWKRMTEAAEGFAKTDPAKQLEHLKQAYSFEQMAKSENERQWNLKQSVADFQFSRDMKDIKTKPEQMKRIAEEFDRLMKLVDVAASDDAKLQLLQKADNLAEQNRAIEAATLPPQARTTQSAQAAITRDSTAARELENRVFAQYQKEEVIETKKSNEMLKQVNTGIDQVAKNVKDAKNPVEFKINVALVN